MGEKMKTGGLKGKEVLTKVSEFELPEIQEAYLDSVKDKKQGALNFKRWMKAFAEKVVEKEKKVGRELTEKESLDYAMDFLAKKSPVIKKVIDGMTETVAMDKSKSAEDEKAPVVQTEQKESFPSRREFYAKFRRFCDKDFFNIDGNRKDWKRITDYNPKTGNVTMFFSSGKNMDRQTPKEVSLDDLEKEFEGYAADKKTTSVKEETGASEVESRLGKYFGKDMYNNKGACIHIVGIEGGRIKFSHRRSGAKEGEEKIKYLNFDNLKSFEDMLAGYSEEKPKKLAEELEAVLNVNLYDKNDPTDWIVIRGYNEADGSVKVFRGKLPKGQQMEKIPFKEVEELLKKYTEKTPPTVDDKKRTKAAKVKSGAKTPEELQGEAMEAFIERNPVEKKAPNVNVAEEKLDEQGEAMEAFIKNSSSDKKAEIYSKLADFSEKDREKLRAYGFADEDGILFEKSEDGQSILVYKIDKNGEKHFVAEEKNGIEISRKKEDGKDPAYTEGSEDEAEERAENTPDKDDEVVFEEAVGENLASKINEYATELEELQSAVARARVDYSKKNYELTNVFTRLKQVLGINLTSTHEKMKDEEELLNGYKKSLNDLLMFEVGKLKELDLSPEELAVEMDRLKRYFNQDEKANLYEARTEARAQVIEKKLGRAGKPVGWLMSGAKKLFHWYERSEGKGVKGFAKGMLKRGSVSATLAAAGLGFSAVAMPGAAAGAYLTKQAIGGAMTGVGVTRMMEGRYRKKENERMAGERKVMAEEIEKISDPEEKLARLTEYMQAEMDGYRDDLDRELKNAGKRKFVGFSAGVASAATLGIISHYFGAPAHPLPKENLISGGVPAGTADGMMNTANEAAKNVIGQAAQASSEEAAKTANEAVASKITEHAFNFGGVEHAVKGDSIWKMVANHFTDNKEFSALSPEQKTYVIDALKDRVASRPANFNLENIDKIKMGYELDFSKLVDSEADFNSIVEHARHLTKAQLDNIGHNNEAILHWVQDHPGQVLDSPKVEEILSHVQDHPAAVPADSHIVPPAPAEGPSHIPNAFDHKVPSTEALAGTAKSASDGFTLAPAAGLGAAIGSMRIAKEERKARNNVVKFPDAAARAEREKEKVSQRSAMESEKIVKEYKLVPSEDASARAMKLIKKVAINSKENWDLMKGAKFSGWKKGVPVELVTEQGKKLTPKLTKNIRKLVADMIDYSGEKVPPIAGETVFKWIARASKISLQEEKIEDLQKAA